MLLPVLRRPCLRRSNQRARGSTAPAGSARAATSSVGVNGGSTGNPAGAAGSAGLPAGMSSETTCGESTGGTTTAAAGGFFLKKLNMESRWRAARSGHGVPAIIVG